VIRKLVARSLKQSGFRRSFEIKKVAPLPRLRSLPNILPILLDSRRIAQQKDICSFLPVSVVQSKTSTLLAKLALLLCLFLVDSLDHFRSLQRCMFVSSSCVSAPSSRMNLNPHAARSTTPLRLTQLTLPQNIDSID